MIDDDDIEEAEERLETERETVDASSKRRLRRVLDQQKQEEQQALEFWTAVFGHPIGRSEMWKLLVRLSTFETPFMTGPNGFPQPEATWFKAGAQTSGMSLYQEWLVKYPDGIRSMHVEKDPRFRKPEKK